MSVPPNDSLELDPLTEPPLELRQTLRSFGGMLAISTLLHMAIWLLLVSGPRGVDLGQAPVVELNLTEMTLAAPPMTEPAPAPLEETADPTEELPIEPPPTPPTTAAVTAPPTATPVEQPPPSSIMFGVSSGAFASFGDGLSLRDEIRPYFLEILEQVNAAWQREGQGVKLRAPAILLISIARNGELVNVQILESSGVPLHDRALLQAVAKAAPFAPVPASFTRLTFETPVRFTPPLSLLSFDRPAAVLPPHN